jgi:hypothetical protein
MTAKRSASAEAKPGLVGRLLAAWEREPHLRLGQIIVDAVKWSTATSAASPGRWALLFIGDEELIAAIEGNARQVADLGARPAGDRTFRIRSDPGSDDR